ncbi:putative ligand-gated ion channel [Dirofilaria immitis]
MEQLRKKPKAKKILGGRLCCTNILLIISQDNIVYKLCYEEMQKYISYRYPTILEMSAIIELKEAHATLLYLESILYCQANRIKPSPIVIREKVLPLLYRLMKSSVSIMFFTEQNKDQLTVIINLLEAGLKFCRGTKIQNLRLDTLDSFHIGRKEAIERTIVKDKSELPTMDDIIGQIEAKKALLEAVVDPFLYPEWFAASGHYPWRCVLLYGPPGTGKTRLSQSIAREMNTRFYQVSSSDLISTWIGQSEKLIRELFDHALAHDGASVIFIDEIDSLCRVRQITEDDNIRRVKTELFLQLQRLQSSQRSVLLICATNCPWELDAAFLRRFEKRIFVGLPDAASRVTLLKKFMNKLTISSNINWNVLETVTDGFSGDDLRRFAREIAFLHFNKFKELYNLNCAISRSRLAAQIPVTMEDFEQTLQKFCPTFTGIGKIRSEGKDISSQEFWISNSGHRGSTSGYHSMHYLNRLLLISIICSSSFINFIHSRQTMYRKNSRILRRLSRLYDWQMDEYGGLHPVIESINGKEQQPHYPHYHHSAISVDDKMKRQQTCANDSFILETILKKYNRHKIPGDSVVVQVEVWVQEITTISDITSDFQLDIYISEMWLDPALDYSWMQPCKYNLSLNSVLLEKLWTPNSCFINSKTADIHRSPFPNIFLMIYSNGSVWTNYRLKLQGPCIMDLTRFPFDNVTCSLTFESFNYNTDEVQMVWSPLGVSKMREKMELADYELTGIENLRKTEPYPAGFWHELTMRFHFKRRAGWYILQAYLPTYLTICISWISFALGSKAIPARTMLGVNSLLAMTFQFGNIIRNLPRVSYVKAIDVWMLSCMTFVFCSLLELAWVGYLSREELEAPKSVTTKVLPAVHHDNNSINLPTTTHQDHYETNSVLSRRRPAISEEENALISLAHGNDYGYIPPGYGLNDHLKATMASIAGPCGCLQQEPMPNTKSFSSIPTSHDPNELSKQRERATQYIDKLSAILFPMLFSVFNIAYWYHYLKD